MVHTRRPVRPGQLSGPATSGLHNEATSRRPKREGRSTEWTNSGGPDEWTGHTGGPVSGKLPECARRARGDGWTSDER